jgi:hypothetical protein
MYFPEAALIPWLREAAMTPLLLKLISFIRGSLNDSITSIVLSVEKLLTTIASQF